MTDHPKLAALAVVLHAGKVILVRRRNPPDAGLWGFPGGHVDLGETALAAAARELGEETTVLADPLAYLTNVDVIVPGDMGGFRHHFLLAAVLCRYRSGTPIARDDVSEAGWFDVAEVLRGCVPLSARVRTVLQCALSRPPDDPEKPISRNGFSTRA